MKQKIDYAKLLIVLIYAFMGWTLCGVVMFIGTAVTSEFIALIIHAVAAPIIFAVVSSFYFKKYNLTTPLESAVLFVAFVVLLDFVIVALLIDKSLAMFGNVLETWIRFILIFISTYYTGRHEQKKA
jgi:Na+/phosphate symporter